MRSQSGFTLIELMVAMALSLLLILAAISLLLTNQRSVETQRAVMGVHDELRFSVEMLMRAVRTSDAVLSTSDAGRLALSGGTLSPSCASEGQDFWVEVTDQGLACGPVGEPEAAVLFPLAQELIFSYGHDDNATGSVNGFHPQAAADPADTLAVRFDYTVSSSSARSPVTQNLRFHATVRSLVLARREFAQ
ncbi:PilW family protein [Thioalkalivibrio thiocyanodenitrificans]|uniref:PilW family protein n=1 Tax=Thioalkalivibrio thiocyanodenitrificans TaxID=243063 RepID=UPI000362308E|nr:prepilin-type N-terminal cleavage/methylation domain-containing protein [Thioalkalivibrio thiocyanodenitrificans]